MVIIGPGEGEGLVLNALAVCEQAVPGLLLSEELIRGEEHIH